MPEKFLNRTLPLGLFLSFLVGLTSCGNTPKDICSNERVINSIGTALFYQDYVWLGDKYVKKSYHLSDEELSKIKQVVKDYSTGKITEDQFNEKLSDLVEEKISLKKLVSASFDGKDKNRYLCSAEIEVGGKTYLAKYEIRKEGENTYLIKMRGLKLIK
ncbi:MAG TPA: hypothetical protein EYO62_01085 [Aquificales bacterium]|nr:hypothetical protein [Aquificales bacterium]